MAETEKPAARVQALKCTSCAAPIELRSPATSVRVACSYCGSILDATNPALEIIQKSEQALRIPLIIPLGKRGQIRGEKMECIGMMRRRVTVEGIDYDWSEYLLWNPFKGFRYLAECSGHWNYIKVSHLQPTVTHELGGAEQIEYLGKTYKHFQSARARVVHVVGEFNWQVAVGDVAEVADFVCPPLVISRESDGNEITWSVGEYISPESVWKAFALAGNPREAIGVAPTEPWPHEAKLQSRKKLWGAFCVAAALVHFLFMTLSTNSQVLSHGFSANAADLEKSRVTPVFELTGRTSNVVVELSSQLSNNWAYVNMALINDETGDALDFGREVSAYHGVEDGEAWSETSLSDRAYLSSVPAGKYYLRMEPETGVWPITWGVVITRDVPLWRLPMLAILFLAVPPLWLMYRRRSFEYRRWLESDHPMDPLVNFSASTDDDD